MLPAQLVKREIVKAETFDAFDRAMLRATLS
jgi:hypothetical protein